jgi:hypothetical protein
MRQNVVCEKSSTNFETNRLSRLYPCIRPFDAAQSSILISLNITQYLVFNSICEFVFICPRPLMTAVLKSKFGYFKVLDSTLFLCVWLSLDVLIGRILHKVVEWFSLSPSAIRVMKRINKKSQCPLKRQPQIAKTQTLITLTRSEKKLNRTTHDKWNTRRQENNWIRSFPDVNSTFSLIEIFRDRSGVIRYLRVWQNLGKQDSAKLIEFRRSLTFVHPEKRLESSLSKRWRNTICFK